MPLMFPTASLMSALWVSDHTKRQWQLRNPCEVFEKKYHQVQTQTLDISCMDDLLSGELCTVPLLSKSSEFFILPF